MPFQGLGNGFPSTRMGPLQCQLQKGEYAFFKYSPMFESDFVQINKQGGPIEIDNREQIVTVGITSSSPRLLIPDVLLLARPIHLSEDSPLPHGAKFQPGCQLKYELSRLFPLRLVKISIHNAGRQQLRFKLASGRTFYLQLCPGTYKQEELFDAWARMIQILWPPSETELKRKEFGRIRSSPPPRSTSPSPKPTTVSMTAWSDLMEDKGKRRTSRGKSPGRDPSPPPRAEEEAVLITPWPAQTSEMTGASEEELVESSPSSKPQAAENGRHKRSLPSRRRSTKESCSSRRRSRQRGAPRKPSKLLSLIRSCSWGIPKQKRHTIRRQSREKKWSTR